MKNEQIANDLLTPLWLGIDSDYKRKYSYSVWQQFEDNIKSAAYTSTLSKFLSIIKQRLNIEVKSADTEKITAIINSGEDKAVLNALRGDTALLVLMVRVANEEKNEIKKQAFEKKKKEKEAFMNSELFGGEAL